MKSTPQYADDIARQQIRRLDDRAVLLERRQDFDERKSPSDELAQASARAHEIYNEFGSVPPSPLSGEDGRSYRLRIVDELKKHSPQHRGISLRALAVLDDAAFGRVEDQILHDALGAGRAFAPPGTLRERRVMRADGIPMTEFAGDPRVWLSHFMQPGRSVRSMKGPFGMPLVPNRGTVR